MAGFRVILEGVPGQPGPQVVEHGIRHHRDAIELAKQWAWHWHRRGHRVKALVQIGDSADQLQVDRQGRAVRDQAHMAAVGENVTIHAPTARAAAISRPPSGAAPGIVLPPGVSV